MKRIPLVFAAAVAMALSSLPPPVFAGNWKVVEDVSPIDDVRTVTLALAGHSESELLGGGKVWPILILSCRASKLAAGASFGTFLTVEDRIQVTERLDKEPARTLGWNVASDYKSISRPQPGQWITPLLAAKKLLLHLIIKGVGSIDATFDVTGLDKRVGKLRDGCEWTP